MGSCTSSGSASIAGVNLVNYNISATTAIRELYPCLHRGCAVLATSEAGLRVHMLQDHSARHKCPLGLCEETFGRKADAERHMGKHGPPKFLCPVENCPYNVEKGFYRKDKLTSHLKSIHMKNAPASSPIEQGSRMPLA